MAAARGLFLPRLGERVLREGGRVLQRLAQLVDGLREPLNVKLTNPQERRIRDRISLAACPFERMGRRSG